MKAILLFIKKKMINHLKAVILILSVIIGSYSIASIQDFINAINKNNITELNRLLSSAPDTFIISIIDELLANEVGRLLNSDVDGEELLGIASEYGAVKTVRALIALEVNPNGKENRPLFAAVVNGYSEIVKVLIDAGADLEKVENEYRGDKLLHIAVIYGRVEAIRLLIDKKADVNTTNNADDTPLHIAARSQYNYSTQQLLDYRLQPPPFKKRKEIIIALIDAGADLEAVNKDGDKPLHIAAALGGVKTVRLLIDKGADVNTRNPINGNTPLHVAAGSPYSNASTIRALIRAGADLDAVNKNGNKPLDLASSQGQIRRVMALQASTGFNRRQLTATVYNFLRRQFNSCADSLTSLHR